MIWDRYRRIYRWFTKMIQVSMVLGIMAMSVLAQHSGQQENSKQPMASASELYGNMKINQDVAKSAVLNKIITLDLKNATLANALKAIAGQTGLKLSYDTQLGQLHKKITLTRQHITVHDALWKVLEGTGMHYAVSPNGHLILMRRYEGERKAVQETVTGQITDAETGEFLPGVNVIVKGTTIGTSTDSNGDYELTVPSLQDTLIFSFIGYQTREIPLQGRSILNISLQPQAISGDELVVIGYGRQKKSNLTQSASQIDGEDLRRRPNPNLSESLQGTTPGLNYSKASGNPGTEANLNIRGFTSINGGEPLILVDGVQENLNNINPQDVESVTVLKDASATAIYGTRAAFGVVLVTTKDAEPGDLQVSYGNNFSWLTTTTNTDFVTDPYQAATLVDESFRTSTGNSYTGYTESDYEELQRRSEDPSLPDVVVDNRGGREQYIYYGNTNWWDTLFRKWRPTSTHNVSISGGSDRINAYVSGRVYNNLGILKVQDDTFGKINFRGELNFQVNNWLSLSESIRINTEDQVIHGGSMYGWSYPWPGLIWMHTLPSYVPQNPDGTATFRTGLNNYTVGGDGLVASLLYGKSKENRSQREFLNTFGARITPLANMALNFSYTTQWQFNENTRRNTEFPWSLYPGQVNYAGNDLLREIRQNNTYNSLSINVKYQHSTGPHHFEEMIGLNYENREFGSIDAQKRNLISDDLNALNLGASDDQALGSASEWAVLGYFFRLNYNYDARYLLEINGRYDGSSRFPEDERWGFFPSISAGWLLSNESFFDAIQGTVNELKLRASYGSLGNQQVATYAYTPTLTKGTANYLFAGNRMEYISPPGVNPRSISWEEVNTTNLGLDLSLFQDRFITNVDFFQRETIGMLAPGKTLPAVLGTGSPQENAADLRTRGFEVKLTYQNTFSVAGKPLNFSFTGTLANQVSKVTKFDNPNKFLGDYYEGQTIGEIWGYQVDGLFQTDEEAANHADLRRVNGRIIISPGRFGQPLAGDVKYLDLNDDGVISEGENTVGTPGDRGIIGNAAPRFPYSFSVKTNWSNIDLSVFFQGIGKQDWYPNRDSRFFWAMYARPYASFIRKDLVNNMWSPENTDAYFPRSRGYSALRPASQLGTVNDRYLQDISYLRLKNLTVGYTLPQQWLEKMNIRSIRIFASGENLLTFSKLTDYIDPEAASNSVNFANSASTYSNNGQRTSAQGYPFSKIYSVGINIDF